MDLTHSVRRHHAHKMWVFDYALRASNIILHAESDVKFRECE